jgi:ABC-type multidrug transport system fused ATPase/permease subunit
VRNYLRLLGSVIGPRREGLAGVFALFILLSILEAIGIGLVVPLFSILDLGQGGTPDSSSMFGRIAAVLVGLGLGDPGTLFALLAIVFYVKAVLGYITQKAIYDFGFKHQKRLIDGLVRKYQAMSIAEYSRQESSVLLQNLIGNVEVVSLGAIVASIRLVSETVVIIGITIVLLFAQPVLSPIMVLLIVVVVLTYDRLFRKRIRRTGELAAQAREAVIRNFQAVMQGFKEIHVIGRMEYFNRLIFEGTTDVRTSAVEYKALNAIPRYMMESAAITGFAAIFIIGSAFGMSQGDIVAAIGTFAVAALRIIPGANQVSASIIQMRNAYYALEKVSAGLEVTVEEDSSFEAATGAPVGTSVSIASPGNLAGVPIEFRDVVFRYQDGGNPILEGVNLVITPGQLVGFKGSSGSGKSTSLDLILGFYAPTSGAVLADGKPLPQPSSSWVANFAYVPQESFLFTGSIRENIALGMPEGTHGVSLSDAIRLACLEDFVAELPDGIDSKLGERAVNISGGQRQRIALARAFYLDRPFIILDEPTSALDAETARLVMNNILSMRGSKTIILTSHDPSVSELCDAVYEFTGGRVDMAIARGKR